MLRSICLNMLKYELAHWVRLILHVYQDDHRIYANICINIIKCAWICKYARMKSKYKIFPALLMHIWCLLYHFIFLSTVFAVFSTSYHLFSKPRQLFSTPPQFFPNRSAFFTPPIHTRFRAVWTFPATGLYQPPAYPPGPPPHTPPGPTGQPALSCP